MRHVLVALVAAALLVLALVTSHDPGDDLRSSAPATLTEDGARANLVLDLTAAETPAPGGASGSARTPAAAADMASADTVPLTFAGRAFLGTYGALANAPLRVSVHAGIGRDWDDLGPALASTVVRSDEHGLFTGAVAAPRSAVTLCAVPELDDHRVNSDVRTVLEGDAGPRDLEPRAYRLDAVVLGRVVDRSGSPIEGALVSAHLADVRSSGDGSFALRIDSTYPSPTARVFAEGYAPASIAFGALAPGEQPGPEVVLVPDRTLTGRVVDAGGNPLAGVRMSALPQSGAAAASDADGHFELGGFDPDATQYRLVASLEGYYTASHRIARDKLEVESDRATIGEPLVLRRGARITGRVVDEAGRAIDRAIVSRGGHPNASGTGIAVTDSGGRFELIGTHPGKQPVWARCVGFAADCIEVDVIDEAVADVEITLRPGHTIRGTVVDEGGAPIAFAEVRPESDKAFARYYVGDSTRTDVTGAFTLVDLPGSTASVRIFAADRADELHRVEDGARIVLDADRTGRIAALVVDAQNGEPIDSFTVRFVSPDRAHLRPGETSLSRFGAEWLRQGVTFSGTAGVLDTSHESLPCDAVTALVVDAPGYAPCNAPRVVVTRDAPPTDLVIRLHRGVVLSGVVTVLETGAPIPGARVRWFADGVAPSNDPYRSEAGHVAKTDAHGRYEMTGVAPGSVVLVVDDTGLAVHREGPFDVAPSSAAVERNVAVPSGGSIRGRFVDEAGLSIAGANVRAYGPLVDGSDRVERKCATAGDGSFVLQHLEPGPYHLTGSAGEAHGGWSLTRLVEVPSAPPLELSLGPEGRGVVVGTVAYQDIAGVTVPESYCVDLLPESGKPGGYASCVMRARVQNGNFRAVGLQPGTWDVRLTLLLDNAVVAGSTTVIVPEAGEVSAAITAVVVKR